LLIDSAPAVDHVGVIVFCNNKATQKNGYKYIQRQESFQKTHS
jgi:hypothetical protein